MTPSKIVCDTDRSRSFVVLVSAKEEMAVSVKTGVVILMHGMIKNLYYATASFVRSLSAMS